MVNLNNFTQKKRKLNEGRTSYKRKKLMNLPKKMRRKKTETNQREKTEKNTSKIKKRKKIREMMK